MANKEPSDPAQAKPPKTDWEAVERDYRAGMLSLREIGKQQGVSEGMIRKKAKALRWERDLSERINEKVRNELVRNLGTQESELRTADPRTEREIIETAAATKVQVVREHRASIKRMNGIVLALLDELDAQTIDPDLYAELGEMLRAEDDKGQDKRNDLYLKIISGAGRIDGLKKLAETLKILVALERQAFSIVDDSGGEDGEAGAARTRVVMVPQKHAAVVYSKAISEGGEK